LLITFVVLLGLSSTANLIYAFDASVGKKKGEQALDFMAQARNLFTEPADQVKVTFHSYGTDSLNRDLRYQIAKKLSPYSEGESRKNLADLLKEIDSADVSSGKNILVVFVNGKVIGNQVMSDQMQQYGKQLERKGFKIVVIGTSPNVDETEISNITPGATILNPGTADELPTALDDLERVIGDVVSGNETFLWQSEQRIIIDMSFVLILILI